jgi:uncharacterized metal-binding protein
MAECCGGDGTLRLSGCPVACGKKIFSRRGVRR